jgi:hypothetical protein
MNGIGRFMDKNGKFSESIWKGGRRTYKTKSTIITSE